MSRVRSDTPIGSDLCQCGDYRSQHGSGLNAFCRVCHGIAPYDGCTAFRFSRCALPSEVEHWRQYHSGRRVNSRDWKK